MSPPQTPRRGHLFHVEDARYLSIVQCFGELSNEKNKDLEDLNLREQWTLIPLIILAFWIGLYPKPFFERMAPTVDRVLERVQVAMPETETAAEHVAAVAEVPHEEPAAEAEETESHHGE